MHKMNHRRDFSSERMANALTKEGIKFKKHFKTTDENGKSVLYDFAVLDEEDNVVETFNLKKQKFHTQLKEKDIEKLKAFTEKEITEKDAMIKTKNGEFFSRIKMDILKKCQEKGKMTLVEEEKKNKIKKEKELKEKELKEKELKEKEKIEIIEEELKEKGKTEIIEEEIKSRDAMRIDFRERFNIPSKTGVSKKSVKSVKKIETETLINPNDKNFIKELKEKTKKVKE